MEQRFRHTRTSSGSVRWEVHLANLRWNILPNISRWVRGAFVVAFISLNEQNIARALDPYEPRVFNVTRNTRERAGYHQHSGGFFIATGIDVLL